LVWATQKIAFSQKASDLLLVTKIDITQKEEALIQDWLM
jgi:hypothetical protein